MMRVKLLRPIKIRSTRFKSWVVLGTADLAIRNAVQEKWKKGRVGKGVCEDSGKGENVRTHTLSRRGVKEVRRPHGCIGRAAGQTRLTTNSTTSSTCVYDACANDVWVCVCVWRDDVVCSDSTLLGDAAKRLHRTEFVWLSCRRSSPYQREDEHEKRSAEASVCVCAGSRLLSRKSSAGLAGLKGRHPGVDSPRTRMVIR